MEKEIKRLLNLSLEKLRDEGFDLQAVEPQLTIPKERVHGDYASNLALSCAAALGMTPRDLARRIVDALPGSDVLEKVEIAGPGFINFYVRHERSASIVQRIIEADGGFGHGTLEPKKVLVEYVSANPTGPLHVGHGRGAAYGESVAALLQAAGCDVVREYYVNDAGRQMDILTVSVWLRYLELGGMEIDFPDNAYQGDYVWDIAAMVRNAHRNDFQHTVSEAFAGTSCAGDAEKRLDVLIQNCRSLIGAAYTYIRSTALDVVLNDVRKDLISFGIRYDTWVSEEAIREKGRVDAVMEILDRKGHLYEHDGALWFRSSSLGDDKDRVVRRDNGQFTYFASDIAYHFDKYERGYDLMINVWGADHHGYVPRLRAALQALGLDPDKLHVVLVQFANLYRRGGKLSMSTRLGQFVTLRELCEEVGNDAARFFYVMRRPIQHIDFDVDLAKSQSADNPVYYVQYAHARICSVMRRMEARGMRYDQDAATPQTLTDPDETALIRMMAEYENLLQRAALDYGPHLLLNFLRELAARFHSYYNRCVFLADDARVRNSRIMLLQALRLLIADGLSLIGVSVPERMSREDDS